MRIKVGSKWYEPKPNYPVMVELTDVDKQNIKDMLSDATKYAVFDDNGMFPWTKEDKLNWMKE